MWYTLKMTSRPVSAGKIGYNRREFNAIFQLYSRHVYTGLFRDFSFTDYGGRYFISFSEEAGKAPLITVEKRRLGPERVLFVATTQGTKGRFLELARSEKLENFTAQLAGKIEGILLARTAGGNIRSFA